MSKSDDLISRQVAIDALTRKMVSIPTAGEKDLMGDVNRIRTEDISVIRRLPSAQPEVLACGEGELSAQPEDICSECDAWNLYKNYAQPQRTGRWISQDHNKSNGMVSTAVFYYPKCSECGHSGNYDMNFCPNCGADMRGEPAE